MAEFNDPAGTTFMRWSEPVLKRVQPPAPQHATPIAPPSRPSVAIPVIAGVVLASIVVTVGLPWLLTGELQLTSWTVKGPLLVTSFTTFGWFVWRMRGSEIRAHGGWQAWPPALVMAAVAGLLLLTGCKSDIRPTTSPTQQTGAADPLQDIVQSAATAMAGVTNIVSTPSAPTGTGDGHPWGVWGNSPTATPAPTRDTNCSHVGLCGWNVLQGGGK